MRSHMEYDTVGADSIPDLHRVAHRQNRLLVHGVVGRGEVAEVERVAHVTAHPGVGALLAEALEALRVVVRRPPRARALGEDLHRVGTEVDGTVDRLVDPTGGGDVRADQHQRSQASSRTASSWTSRRQTRGSGANGSIRTRPRSARHSPATKPSTRNVASTIPPPWITVLRCSSETSRVRSACDRTRLS